MHRFYCPDIAATLTLTEDESRHCVRVLRLVEGDEVEVVDGRGTTCRCRITLAHPKRCGVEILEQQSTPPLWGHRMVLCVAPTKHIDRLEWMLEKCVEMGIDRVIPVRCHNSERVVLKTDRLRAIMVAAMKQSLKATLPTLDELTPIEQVLQQPFTGDRFIAYCDPLLPREQRREFATSFHAGIDTMVLIGPEGDFSADEVDTATASGWVPVTLGESRLRTETAGVMAVAAMHTIDALNRR